MNLALDNLQWFIYHKTSGENGIWKKSLFIFNTIVYTWIHKQVFGFDWNSKKKANVDKFGILITSHKIKTERYQPKANI